jgi:hypothetical protein
MSTDIAAAKKAIESSDTLKKAYAVVKANIAFEKADFTLAQLRSAQNKISKMLDKSSASYACTIYEMTQTIEIETDEATIKALKDSILKLVDVKSIVSKASLAERIKFVVNEAAISYPADAPQAITEDDWKRVKASFYMAADGKTLTRDLPEVAAVKNLERWANDGGLPKNIATMYYTDTTTKESFINFAKRLKAGGTIRQELKNPGEYYGEVVHNSKLYGYYYTKAENGKYELGRRTSNTKNPDDNARRSETIKLTDKVKQQLIDAKLNIKETTAKHVLIEGLARGVLFADKNTERFVPFYDDERNEITRGGQAYTTAQVADLMIKNVETLFPPVVEDEENKTDSP